MVSSKMFLLPAIYHTRCEFSSLSGLMKRIGSEFSSVPFGKDATLSIIRKLIDKLESIGKQPIVGQNVAEKLLIAKDLKKVENQVLSMDEFDPARLISEDFEKLVTKAEKMGFDTDSVRMFQVDEFPKPFQEMGWSFFNADKTDAEKYGIPFGIYVKKSAAIPLYTTFLLSHELIHVAVGLKASDKIARGLEEGLAELLGCMLLFSRLKGRQIAANLMIYNRLYYPPNQYWDVYLDNLKQAILIYQLFGLAGLNELIHSGRDKIKEVEKVILKGEWNELNLARGEWDSDVDYLTSLILAFPRNYVVSPLAKYLSDFVAKGVTIKEILTQNNIDINDGEVAINELARKLFLVVISDGMIANCDMDTMSDRTVFRYLLD